MVLSQASPHHKNCCVEFQTKVALIARLQIVVEHKDIKNISKTLAPIVMQFLRGYFNLYLENLKGQYCHDQHGMESECSF